MVGLGDLGPPVHALGQLGDLARPPRGDRRLGPASGGGRRVAGGPGVSVGQPLVEPGRQPGVRRRPDRVVAALSPGSGAAGRGGSRPAPWSTWTAEFHAPDWVLGQSTMAELARRLPGLPDARATAATRWSGSGPPAAGTDGDVVHRGRRPALCEHRRAGRHRRRRRAGPETGVRARLDRHRGPGRLRAPAGRRAPGPAAVGPSRAPAASRPPTSPGPGRSPPRPPAGPVPGLFFAPANRRGRRARPGPGPRWWSSATGGRPRRREPGFDPVVQFFTSRGLAVAVVDYRGSSGYGRAYRRALDGLWGEADIDDCVALRRGPGGGRAGSTAAGWPSAAPVPAASPPSAP